MKNEARKGLLALAILSAPLMAQESGVSLSFRSVISAVRSSPVHLRFRS